MTFIAELLPLPLVLAANVFVGKPWGANAMAIFIAFTTALVALLGLLDISGASVLSAADLSRQSRFAFDAGTIVTAAAAAGFIFRPIRKDLAAFLPFDPDNPMHMLALCLAVLLFGTQVTSIVFTDVLTANNSQPPLTALDLFLDELPFLILAIAGVGLFMRRRVAQAVQRLGLVVPAWWHIALALAAAGVFLAFAAEMDALSHAWTPQIAHRVDATTQHVFGLLSGGPLGIVALALIPGLCEEILFRGALQPRIGLIATALLFTSIHTEYGLSFDTLSVLLIAIGLGLIRKYANTTASATCHVTYNLLVGIGITGLVLDIAIGVEVVLLGATVYAVWAQRRRSAPVNP